MLLDAQPPQRPARHEPARAAAARVWHELGERLAATNTSCRLRVQHLVLAQADIETVAVALRQAGRQIGLDLVLDPVDGELVLLDQALARQMTPQLIAAFGEGRPCLMVDGLGVDGQGVDGQGVDGQGVDGWGLDGPGSVPAARGALRRQLRRQLLALPALRPLIAAAAGRTAAGPGRRQSPTPAAALEPAFAAARASTADSAFDSVWQLDESGDGRASLAPLQLLQQLHKRRGVPAAAPLRASYGAGADLHFDFKAGCVRGDRLALQLLRLQLELPVLVPDLAPDQAPPAEADAVPLQHALWDLGLAAAALPLLGASSSWWHTPLVGGGVAAAADLTRVPSFLEILRRLAGGAVTPAALRREGRINAVDLRRVLQACLLLGLARWDDTPFTPPREIPIEFAESRS